MRVLLIDPPTNCFTGLMKRGYPLGLCMLAGMAHREGLAEVKVFDADKSLPAADGLNFTAQRENMSRFLQGVRDPSHPAWGNVRRVLDEFRPDLVGVSTMTIQYASALQVARVVKEWNRDCTVVMGGAQASVMPGVMVAWPHTDLVVRGEGEAAFCEILARMNAGRREFGDIPGVLTRDTPGKAKTPPEEVPDLDGLPLPDRQALMHLDRYSPEDLGLILTSRGCPYRCSYCSNFTRRVRFRSVESVMEEVLEVRATFGARQFMFKDDAFTIKRERVVDFCHALIRGKVRILWEAATRLDLLDDALCRLMKRAGCNRIGVGVESGDEEMLRVYEKRLTRDQIREGTAVLNRNGIFWTGYFMMGLPMEREEQILRTLAFMKELRPPYAAIGIYKPYPGTKLFRLAEGLGLVEENVGNEHFFETNPVDYFLKDPRNRCAYISEERLKTLLHSLEQAFEENNKSFAHIARRALARKDLYLRDYRSFLTDVGRAVRWLGVRN